MKILTLLFFFFSFSVYAKESVLNIYAWANELPESVIRKFENQTGIKVNIATFENNETMYAKLAIKNPGYDLIMPSSYFVDRMQRQNMLEKLDKTLLPNRKNLDPHFLHPAYDPTGDYSIPHLWGITGLFFNRNDIDGKDLHRWSDLWKKQFYHQIMLLDDTREVFSMALLSLGYSANDRNKEHIKAAFLALKKLMPNVKVFSSDNSASIMIDEDVLVGMGWNGDAYKASLENKAVRFHFPQEGFVIWVDNFSIPKGVLHRKAAYTFLNFLLEAEIAKEVALYSHFPTPNLAAQKQLPESIRNNPVIYPPPHILKHGQFQTDVGDEILSLYATYWEELKMGE